MIRTPSRPFFYLRAVAGISLAWALFAPPTLLAHETTDAGEYRIVVGWANEPPRVGMPNAMTVEIAQNHIPLPDPNPPLILELSYAGRTRRSPLTSTSTPGLYRVELIPTVRGQYTARVSGTLNGLAIDQTLEPEAVEPVTDLQFPEMQPDTHQLQSTLLKLEVKLQELRTWTAIGVGCGLLSLMMAGLGIVMARRAKTNPPM